MSFEVTGQDIPFITTDQMREVDRLMEEKYGILLVQMMENAGRNLARLARQRFLNGDPVGKRVLVLAGSGGNGGGGMVCARWLSNWGASVQVWVTAPPSKLADVIRHQLTILEHMGVPINLASEKLDLPPADLLVDAVIGYSLRGAPSGPAAALIRHANEHEAPVLALDVPSGVDASTGEIYNPAAKAAATLTLALPKQGLQADAAKQHVGELYLADIGVPPELYTDLALGLEVGPVFAQEEIIRMVKGAAYNDDTSQT